MVKTSSVKRRSVSADISSDRGTTAAEAEFLVDEDCLEFEPLQAAKATESEGVFIDIDGWLGVKDGIRNWLVIAA